MFDFLKNVFGGAPTVDLGELIKNGAVVLDVRTPGEFQIGHVKGSINISVESLPSQLKKLEAYKNKTIITCCRSGMRSGSAASILKANGFENVINGGPWDRVAKYIG